MLCFITLLCSVPGSPGASDDGVGVACMLEIARILAKGPALKHSVILLFNGAEENNHQVVTRLHCDTCVCSEMISECCPYSFPLLVG